MPIDPTPTPPAADPVPRPAGLFAAARDMTFRSLKHRDYRLYFGGQIVSLTGSWMQSAALMWLVFDHTNDPLWPPLLLVAQVGPTVLLGPFGGALADRLPKRRLILATQFLFLLNAVVLTALAAAGWATPAVVVVLQVWNGLVQAADLPARLAFVPDLVPRADLINAVSLNSLVFNAARATGPAAAGLLFAAAESPRWAASHGAPPVVAGAVACFALNAVSYAAVLAALARIRAAGDGNRGADRGSPLDGVRYVAARPILAAVLALTGLLSVFGWPVISLFPAYTRLVLGLAVTEYSRLVSSLGGGALVGALVTATFGTVGRRGLFLTVGGGLAAAGLAGLTAAPGLTAACLAAGCGGCGLILFLSTGQSTLQLNADEASRGRVMALWAMTLSASAPLGHLLAGLAAREWGVGPVLAVMTAGAVTVAAAVAAVSAVRGWRVGSR